MTAGRDEFQRFIHRVHRRYLLLHVLERTGLGLLGGCAAGSPLAGIALWQGLPAGPLAIAALGTGAAIGFLWGFITRPTLVESAGEADRQLESADLLSSAVLVADRGDDPWSAAVVAEADRWCGSRSPSSVVLNRLGARAWGGIGLAAALMAVLSLLPTYAVTSQAGERTGGGINLQSEQDAASRRQLAASSHRSTGPDQEPEDIQSSRMLGPVAPEQHNQAEVRPSDSQKNEYATSPKPNGQGAGESHSKVADSAPLPDPQSATDSQDSSPGARQSGGAGLSSDKPTKTGTSSGAMAGATPSTSFLPPWKSDHWPADVARAQQAVQQGQIPAQYRDMIREYFQR